MLWRTGLAALLFLATSLFLLREVLPAPDSLLQTFETAGNRWRDEMVPHRDRGPGHGRGAGGK